MAEILELLTDLLIPFAIQRLSENQSGLFCHFRALLVAAEKVQWGSRNDALSIWGKAEAALEDAGMFWLS